LFRPDPPVKPQARRKRDNTPRLIRRTDHRNNVANLKFSKNSAVGRSVAPSKARNEPLEVIAISVSNVKNSQDLYAQKEINLA